MKRARNPKGARIAVTDTHKNPDDVIMVPALNPMGKERNGYPTQKPVALLETVDQGVVPPGRGGVGIFLRERDDAGGGGEVGEEVVWV